MPTYTRQETVGAAAEAVRVPVSGKDENGNAQALPVATSADAALSPTSQPVVVVREIGSLAEFSKVMFHTLRLVKKAPTSLDEIQSIPHHLSENMESQDGGTIVSLPSGGPVDLVGQVFRASLDNLSHVAVHLGVSGAGIGLFTDDFETYANDAALQSAWVPSDATNTNVTLYTTAPHGGVQAMRIAITKNLSAGDTVSRTFAAQDWSNIAVMRFWARSDRVGEKVQMRIRIGDGTSSKSSIIQATAKDTWEEFTVNASGMVNDGAFSPNMAAITTIEWEVVLHEKTAEWIVDDLSVEGDAGTIRMRVFNVSSASPGTLGTQIGTDQIVDLNNRSSDRYIAAFGGAPLTYGNHYAVVLDSLTKPVTVTGLGDTKAGGGYYNNGLAFTSTDGGTNLTTQANDDLAFDVYGGAEGYLLGFRVRFDADANGTELTAFIEDPTTEKKVHVLGHDIRVYGTDAQMWFWPSSPILTGSGAVYVAQGRKVELQVQWADDTPALELSMDYLFAHKPVTSWG